MSSGMLKIFWPDRPLEEPRSWGHVFVLTLLLGGIGAFMLSVSTVNILTTTYQQNPDLLFRNSLVYLLGFIMFFVAVVLPFGRSQSFFSLIWRATSLILGLFGLFLLLVGIDSYVSPPPTTRQHQHQESQVRMAPQSREVRPPAVQPSQQAQQVFVPPTSKYVPPPLQPLRKVDPKPTVDQIVSAPWVERQDNLCAINSPPFCLFINGNSSSRLSPRLTWDAKLEFKGIQVDDRLGAARVDCTNQTIEIQLPGEVDYVFTRQIVGSHTFGARLLDRTCQMLR